MIDHSAINILVLDDEPFMPEVLMHMPGRFGRVAVADNGASAFAALASALPACMAQWQLPSAWLAPRSGALAVPP